MNSEVFHLHAAMEERHWWFVGRRRILKDLIGAIEQPDDNTLVLEVGCGTGANLAALSRDYRVIGIDPSAEAIEMARCRFPNVSFHVGYAPRDLPEHARGARVLVVADVLEHVRDDAALLHELVHHVRPGSHLIVTVPADPALWSQQDISHGHFRRYTLESFQALWAGLPVTERLVSAFSTRLFPAVKAVRAMSRLSGRAFGAAGTDLRLPPQPLNVLLARIFAGESHELCSALRQKRGTAYRFGVSLVSVLRKDAECEGVCE